MESELIYENGRIKITFDVDGKKASVIYNEKQVAALIKVLDDLDYDSDEESLLDNLKYDYLTINKCRNGREVAWYIDESHNKCIYVDTLEELTDAEIEEQLL